VCSRSFCLHNDSAGDLSRKFVELNLHLRNAPELDIKLTENIAEPLLHHFESPVLLMRTSDPLRPTLTCGAGFPARTKRTSRSARTSPSWQALRTFIASRTTKPAPPLCPCHGSRFREGSISKT
jgi:hypothetical protein